MNNCSIYHSFVTSKPSEVFRISSDGNVGIGTGRPSQIFESYDEWTEILKLAETNTAVKTALDKLRTTYYLSKDNGSKT